MNSTLCKFFKIIKILLTLYAFVKARLNETLNMFCAFHCINFASPKNKYCKQKSKWRMGEKHLGVLIRKSIP